MKTRIMKLYGVAAVLFLFITLYGILKLRVSGLENRYPRYDTLTNFSVATAEDDETPLGEKIIMTGRLENIRGDYNTLVFYSIHQDVRVYLNEECIYSVRTAPGIFWPKSPGHVINQIELEESANGKQIRVELIPHYSSSDAAPELLFGNRYDIVEYVIQANMFTLILCTISILIGLFMIVFIVFGKRSREEQRMFGLLGRFAIVIGVWKAFDSSIFGFINLRFPVASVVPFFALMLLPVMIAQFVRNVTTEKKSVVWEIPDVVNIAAVFVIVFLQVFGIADFWQNLWIAQLCMIVCGICVAVGLVQLVRQHGWKQNVKNAVVSFLCCLVWILSDTLSYYGKHQIESIPLSMMIFLGILAFIGMERFRKSREKMEVGMQARQYSKLAYHDALTGFFNKAAYMEHITGGEFLPQKNVMVAFDLNNLKKCNDELGHDKGDIYIKESAKIIMDCFGDKGRCYRLGGDEFGVIMEGADTEACAKCVERMKGKVRKFNDNSRDIHMGIACGYAVFDPNEDEDINATIRRADKMMYEEKFKMKQLMS